MAPRYMRLAMGSSHSVHILMAINLTQVGRALLASRRLGCGRPPAGRPPPRALLCFEEHGSDESWAVEQADRRGSSATELPVPTAPDSFPCSGSHLKVTQWLATLRELRRRSERVLVVLHLFAGSPRADGVDQFVPGSDK